MDQYKDKQGGSMFGPIILIAVGSIWLLSNLGFVPNINWSALFRLWPLLLIFFGLNMILRQAPRPFGNLLSALVGLIAVGAFVSILLFGADIPLLSQGADVTIIHDHDIEFGLDGATEADVSIETAMVSAEIFALEDSTSLMEGQVSFIGDFIVDGETDGMTAKLRIDNKTNNGWFLDPSTWNRFDADDTWEIGLNATVPMSLDLDGGSGGGNFDLAALQLTDLKVDSGSGAVSVILPGGTYDVRGKSGSGSAKWTLPADGNGRYEFDTGSGSIKIAVPQGVEARIDIDSGSGSFSADSRFVLISGDDDNGVWQTAGYGSADERLDIEIDAGSGSVTIDMPAGR